MMGSFDFFPAIDVAGGELVRLLPGGEVRTYTEEPIEAACRMVEAGARWIHFVDLDMALLGEPRNLDLLERLSALPARIQAGGGLSVEAVDEALRRGATRAVLGAHALLGDEGLVSRAINRHGVRVGMGIDVRRGRVWPRGSEGPGPSLDQALPIVRRLRPAFVVHADAERDGAMAGPDLLALATVSRATGAPVVASGGIRGAADMRAVAGVPGVAGVIVGRALHEGALSLEEALSIATARSRRIEPSEPDRG